MDTCADCADGRLCRLPPGHAVMHTDGVEHWIAGAKWAFVDRTGRVEYVCWWEDAAWEQERGLH